MGEKKKSEKKLLISKKKLALNLGIIIITTGLTVFTLFKNNAFENMSALGNLKWYTFLVILLVVATYIFGEAFVIYRSFRRINPKMNYFDSVGCYLYANLGSSITPAKTGHHPFRLYYLERKGNTFAQSLANATQCQIIYTIVQVVLYGIMSIVSAITNSSVTIYGNTVPLYLVGLIGIAMAFFASGVFLLMSFCPPIKKVLIRFLAWVNVKTKKIQTREEYIIRQEEKMSVMKEQITLMFTHFWETVPSLLVYTLCIIANNCLPYVVYCVIALHPFSFVEMCYFFALYQCISYISNIVPLPGNTGAAEVLFKVLFTDICNGFVGPVLLMWRLCSYYLVLIVEIFFFISSSVAIETKKELKLHKILNETRKGYTEEVHSHFDTMEMELLSINFKNTQCYNCCHLQNNLFQCDKYKDKPDDILNNTRRCPFYEEKDNGEVF